MLYENFMQLSPWKQTCEIWIKLQWFSLKKIMHLQCLKQAVTHSLNSTWLSGERPQIVCGRLKISMVI